MVDSHEDLAWNMLTFGRDYTLSAASIRAKERDTFIPSRNGDTLLGWPQYQAANVGIIFSTLFAAPIHTQEGEWDTECYCSQNDAYTLYQRQLDTYERLFDQHHEKFRPVRSQAAIQSLMHARQQATDQGIDPPIGMVTLMEGADCIRRPQELEEWVERGVRLIGLAWQATAYSGGTKEPGPLTPKGFELLEMMEEFNCVLDLSHMDDKAVNQSLDAFQGKIMASHTSPRSMMHARETNRFMPDHAIQAIADRGGVIGLVPYNLFLDPYVKKEDDRKLVSIDKLVDQMDMICQMLGSSNHVGIGTDFDGGFGWQHVPHELDSIADLPILLPRLEKKGYTTQDIENILGQNWLRFLMESLPES